MHCSTDGSLPTLTRSASIGGSLYLQIDLVEVGVDVVGGERLAIGPLHTLTELEGELVDNAAALLVY